MKLEERFEREVPFPLDGFQLQANRALARGTSVLVCAPTGAGKTIVGEFGVWLALQRGGKAFYTTPLKALSNQKFGDFIARYGADRVGLLTGDNSINGQAPVVVMTTEVLRNMLYERSDTLQGLSVVVLDEVHFLQDQYRGATWEEILIHLPAEVQIAALSATVSNAEEFGDWLRSVRGEVEVVLEERRPVPIEHRYMVGPRLHPMFVGDDGRVVPNPALLRLRPRPRHRGGSPRGGQRSGRRNDRRDDRSGGRERAYRPDRIEVVERLQEERLLPAIVFVFSRAGCEQAVRICASAHLELTDPEERERIREYVELRANVLVRDDLVALGYEAWADALERGIAAHHAGLIPLFKETVEELFERALVKVVFATETLALGINMPAKTVVIERLMKFTGERHEMLTEAEYTQLTGRAGRRGMDEIGFGVTLLQEDIGFDRIAELAEGRWFPLRSSFRPSYNMAVNLLRTHTVPDAQKLLNLSFAQFLADRSVVKQEKQVVRNEKYLAGYRESAACDRGDIGEYWALVGSGRREDDEARDRFRRDRAQLVRAGFDALRPGQVVLVRRGSRAGLAAVVEVRHGKGGEPQPVVLTKDRRVVRLAVRDFREPPAIVGDIRLPRGDPRAPQFRHQVGRQLEQLKTHEPAVAAPGREGARSRGSRTVIEEHPVHACPDRDAHLKWMERIEALQTETASLRKRVRRRTETLARVFERVLAVLEAFGYVNDGEVTERGSRLARIYNESDLLVSEALHGGLLDPLDPAEMAAVVSTLVYETRIGAPSEDFQTDAAHSAFRGLVRLFKRITIIESDHGLELVREPDPGFAWQISMWASGASLDEVLEEGEMSAGDFVRNCKQAWDLLRQLGELDIPGPVPARCREAAAAIYRGVVAYSGAL